jgi:hypothetical protein
MRSVQNKITANFGDRHPNPHTKALTAFLEEQHEVDVLCDMIGRPRLFRNEYDGDQRPKLLPFHTKGCDTPVTLLLIFVFSGSRVAWPEKAD